jgi:DNA sulfur modification protein DndB
MLGDLTDTPAKRVTEYRARKARHAERTFRKDEQSYALAQGWEFVRENKASLRFRKLKPADEQLENEFWCILYQLGYPVLNVGRSFQIQLSSKSEGSVSKQVDVFAYDGETIIVAECKCSEIRQRRSLQKDIGEFDSLKRPIAKSIERHFGYKPSQKIIWLMITRNIDWSTADVERAVRRGCHHNDQTKSAPR